MSRIASPLDHVEDEVPSQTVAQASRARVGPKHTAVDLIDTGNAPSVMVRLANDVERRLTEMERP